MARFWAGMNLERRKRTTSSPLTICVYHPVVRLCMSAKIMKPARAGLGISASEWKITMDHAQPAISKLKVPDREGKELLASFLSLSDQRLPGRETLNPTHRGAAGSPVDQHWAKPCRGRPFGPSAN